MGVFTGLPDFGRPERYGVVSCYAAFEQPGLVSALPFSISPVPVEGGSGPLLVDVYLQERDDGVEEYAVVSTAFELGVPLDTTHRDLRPVVVARPAPLGAGMARLIAPSALGFPSDGLPAQPFDAAAGQVVPSFLRLDAVAGQLLIGALDAGLVAVGAEVWLTVLGVAARCPGALTVEVEALLAALGTAPIPPDDLVDRIATGVPGIIVTGGPDDARVLAAAVADRLTARLGAPGFGGWVFPASWDHETELLWDLSAPAPAKRLLQLSCDPVVAAGANRDAVRRHTAPPLTDGHERVLVHTTLPALPAGVVAATVELAAPPVAPGRPFEATATGQVRPPAPTDLTLVLSPGEPLAFDLQASAVMETDHGPQALTGGPRRVEGDSTPILTAADLGLRLLPVNATDELLDVADLVVTATASRSGSRVRSVARLAPGPRTGLARAWLALPRDADDATLEVAATTRGADPETVRQQLPDAAVWLDEYSFDDPPWPMPGEVPPPMIVEAAGLRAVGRRGDPDWRFLPLTAGPTMSPEGAAQLSLLEAGPIAMLMVTTELRVSDEQQQELQIRCRAASGADDVRLMPAPFEAQEASLLISRDSGLVAMVSVTPSGTVTQDAAFTANLTEADLATVHRALGGGPGLLAVRYLLHVAASGPEANLLAGETGTVTVLSDASTWRT